MRDRRHAPEWEPPRDDVEFDQSTAWEAAAACRSAAMVCAEVGRTRHEAGVVANRFFRGVFAEQFRAQHGNAVDIHVELVGELTDLATRIEVAARQAADEQRRREVLREEWDQEYLRNGAIAAELKKTDRPR
jgi:hypothetical protein